MASDWVPARIEFYRNEIATIEKAIKALKTERNPSSVVLGYYYSMLTENKEKIARLEASLAEGSKGVQKNNG